MFIKITKAHIAAGYAGSCRRCPIALALNEIFDEKIKIEEGSHLGVVSVIFGKNIELILPPIANDFITAFDNGGKNLLPFNFWLPL